MNNSKSSAKATPRSVAEDAQKILLERMAKQRQSSKTDTAPDITSTNAIAKTMLNPSLSPEAKRDELVKLIAFSKESSKEENRAKLQALSEFKEYLQEQRKFLNREGIKLQDTEAFGELQAVLDDMTKSSIAFQDKIKPLLEVLNAVFEIRKQDKITDVYKEIQNDKEWLEEGARELAVLEAELKAKKDKLDELEREKARLNGDRVFLFLTVRQSSKQRIAEIDAVDKVNLSSEIAGVVKRIEEHKKKVEAGRSTSLPELIKQKEVLKEFLDLTKDGNRERQKALIESAVSYVDTSDSRLKSVLGTLDRLGKHAEVMSDANSMLKSIHVIMDDALKNVSTDNQSVKDQLSTGADDESSIARMTREEKLHELNEHITSTDEGAIDIANSIGGLTKHSVQIQAYKDTVRNESSSTKRLHLEGVSQMGEQLMSVLSAISAAATTESRSIAANNFAKMAEQNQTIISQEVVRNATTVEVEANQIARLVGELQDYGDVLNASSGIAQQGYSRMRETIDAIRKVSGSVQGAIKDLVADRADAGIAVGSDLNAGTSSDKPAAPESPLDKLKRS